MRAEPGFKTGQAGVRRARAASTAPIEMSADPAFAPRIKRLALTSAVVLGYIVLLWERTGGTKPVVAGALAGGWLLMPVILWLSLPRPHLRYALILPSSLITLALLLICADPVPAGMLARAGWLLIAAGVLVGAGLGFWFWFRLAPVPACLRQPFSRGRWLLIGLHVALILAGLGLVSLAVFA
ncbi:MAG TPA: hypothetical protein VFI42_16315 [Thermomicrobiaceae bacterium]|nr:hypothetical protein [Thermomicrobiaceae bacterium]